MSPKAIDAGAAITPAAEWLIDNFHVVEKQIREIRADLPPGYYRQLPKLASGPFAGYPRVFGVAWAFVAHTDSLFDPEVLRRYLRAYQEVQPLTIGELWAVAITLRIVLVENLRRIAKRIVDSRRRRDARRMIWRTDCWALAASRAEPADAVLSAAHRDDILGRVPRAVGPSAARSGSQHRAGVGVARRATGAAGDDRRRVVRDEHQRQVAGSVTVRNIITSMRLISDVDWTELFERVSLVDDVFKAGSAFEEWISRRAISIATPSNSSPAAPASPNWRWPTRPLRRRGARSGRTPRRATPAWRIPAII